MSRYLGPKCKLCRREGTKLFLKGAKCYSDKCPMNTRSYPPGQHGPSRRRRLSDYGRHLREKQKVKRIYGVLETQFRRYYEKSASKKGITGELLLQMLERRLDSVVYSSGLGLSRMHARKLVRQGKIKVNGNVVTIPSYQVNEKDMVECDFVGAKPKDDNEMPTWLEWNKDKKAIKILRLPERDDISQEINEQLIVEYYSR